MRKFMTPQLCHNVAAFRRGLISPYFPGFFAPPEPFGTPLESMDPVEHWQGKKGAFMKLVVAIIKPSRLEEVRQALNSLDVHGMTVTEVKGYGRQKGHSEIYRGTEYAVHFLPKLKVEIAVDDALADQVSTAIRDAAQTGRIGDGKIFILDLLAVTRIRTGETGASAL